MGFPFAINCFGAGVFFGILAIQLDPSLAARNPPVWCLGIILMFIVFAAVSRPRRA